MKLKVAIVFAVSGVVEVDVQESGSMIPTVGGSTDVNAICITGSDQEIDKGTKEQAVKVAEEALAVFFGKHWRPATNASKTVDALPVSVKTVN